MHASHWGLEKQPFPTGAAESMFFAGLPQQEALARLRFLVHNQRRLGLVLGEPGWGKTLLLQMFAEECHQENWHAVEINLLGISIREFQWKLAMALGTSPRAGEDAVTLFERLETRLRQNYLLGERVVLLLDDVDSAGADVLSQVLRIVQLPASQVGDLTLVLAANSKQVGRLGKRLLELVDLRLDLEPWDADDTIGYLQLALVAAGADRPIFDEPSLAAIHRFSGGVPRLVNRLADYALVAGLSGDLEQVDAATVAAAFEAISHR